MQQNHNTMNNEQHTIHEFDLHIIYDFFSNTKRQGPGSPEETLKALSFIDGLTGKTINKTQCFKRFFRTSGTLSFCVRKKVINNMQVKFVNGVLLVVHCIMILLHTSKALACFQPCMHIKTSINYTGFCPLKECKRTNYDTTYTKSIDCLENNVRIKNKHPVVLPETKV